MSYVNGLVAVEGLIDLDWNSSIDSSHHTPHKADVLTSCQGGRPYFPTVSLISINTRLKTLDLDVRESWSSFQNRYLSSNWIIQDSNCNWRLILFEIQ